MTPTARALLATVHANPGDKIARMVYADALEESGDEVGAHLQRAIAEPNDDGHRLALADAMERTAGEVECKKCVDGRRWIGPGNIVECRQCSGAGRVSDGRKEWAEFIRVQCELAKPSDCRTCSGRRWYSINDAHSDDCYFCTADLRARERELWPAVRGRFEGYGVEPCYQTGLMAHQPPDGEIVQRSTVIVQRGLPSVVRCTLAEWMGGECGCENGSVDTGGSTPWGEPISQRCPECHGSSRVAGIGPRLAQAWPIERVGITDKRPLATGLGQNSTGGFRWTDEESFSWGLPSVIFARLSTGPTCILIRDAGESWASRISARDYESESAARAALSDAVIEWARGQVIEETK